MQSSPSNAPHLVIGDACTTAAFGLDLCAARTKDPRVKVAALSAAKNLRMLSEEASKSSRKVKLRMRDRLRWEWLASTSASMDGGADSRLLAECASILGLAVRALAPTETDRLALRLRVASAEAWSLSQCVAPRTSRSLEAFA